MPAEQIGNQFSGLPMESLIGAPLKAGCDAQIMLAKSQVDFIQNVGFDGEKTRTADFSFDRNVVRGKDGLGNDIIESEHVAVAVPVLAIINVPSLQVDEINILFDMEVKSSESSKSSLDLATKFSAEGKVGWGPVSLSVKIEGSVASHKEHTRSGDNSAKYNVSVHAAQQGTPEGLLKVLDYCVASIAPQSVSSNESKAALDDKSDAGQAKKAIEEAQLLVDKSQAKRDIVTIAYSKVEQDFEAETNETKKNALKAQVTTKKANLDQAEDTLHDAQSDLNIKQQALEIYRKYQGKVSYPDVVKELSSNDAIAAPTPTPTPTPKVEPAKR